MARFRLAGALLPLLLACAGAAPAAEVADSFGAAVEADPSASQPRAPEASATTEAQQTDASKKKWKFSTIGYVWFGSAKGHTTPRDPFSPVKVDLSLHDVIKALKFAFMGAADARHDRLVFVGDLMWVHLGASQGLTARDRQFAKVKINSKTLAVTALGGYRVIEDGPVVVDLMAGGRLNGNKQTVDYRGTIIDVKRDVSKMWIDPIVATRMTAPLGGKFGVTVYGDIGGFGIGSKLTWQGIAAATYRINHKLTAGAGWRYFKLNYHDNDGFRYNVAQSGPILSLRTDF